MASTNEITFDSKGRQADHPIIAVPLKGKVPPLSQIQKALGKEGAPPPPYVEPRGIQSSAVLEGGLSQTATLELKKPGKYLFFCPLTDRDGGKPHFEEGLIAVQTVK